LNIDGARRRNKQGGQKKGKRQTPRMVRCGPEKSLLPRPRGQPKREQNKVFAEKRGKGQIREGNGGKKSLEYITVLLRKERKNL